MKTFVEVSKLNGLGDGTDESSLNSIVVGH